MRIPILVGRLWVWGMTDGVVCIVGNEDNLNKELCCDILRDDVLGTYHDLGMDYRNYIQQDNDLNHMAKFVSQPSC